MRVEIPNKYHTHTEEYYLKKATEILGRPLQKVEVGFTSVRSSQKWELDLSFNTKRFACICPCCNTELFADWEYIETCFDRTDGELRLLSDEISKEGKQIKQELEEFVDIFCPICGAMLSQEAEYYMPIHVIGRSDRRDFFLDGANKRLDELREIYQRKNTSVAEKKAETYARQMDEVVCDGITADKLAQIRETPVQLQEYMQQLIRMESNVYSLVKHLGELYYQKTECSKYLIADRYWLAEPIKKEIEDAEKVVKQKQVALVAAHNQEIDVTHIEYPSIPVKPDIPEEPELETPGLFNKKRVLAENEIKMTKYRSMMELYLLKMTEYEAAVKEYEQQMAVCCAEEKRQNELNNKKKSAVIQAAQEELNAAQKQYDELISTREMRIAGIYVPTEEAMEMLDHEIAEAERLLKETYVVRNQLYAYNVIFPKYRDLVALSTFYEYLMTGRCETLEGANGAYNLYEAECRADMIISQLSTVIESLEQIKQNQYMIYSELQSINSSLSSLNSTMDAALRSIRNIDIQMGSVVKNTEAIAHNVEVIEHNTAVTAYYSKLNAQLTNALGYMVAFK